MKEILKKYIKSTSRERTYHIVEDDAYGQHGTCIFTTKLRISKKDFAELQCERNKGFFITDDLASAYYYTQD